MNLTRQQLNEFLDIFKIPYIYQKQFVIAQCMVGHSGINENKRIYSPESINKQELARNEYRKFIEENRFKRIEYRSGQISIPRIQCTTSNGNTIKYASRRFPDDMVK